MPRVSEKELVCVLCRKSKKFPVCCGKKMEKDDFVFFCPTCGREIQTPVCCGKEMEVKNKVLDIKKEIFKNL
ncbi:MAG: hypothetical protein JXB88_06865 [Spirochaetales bacterium]|nr:hypothetical protein [Spirochaetales bacterium]